MVQQQSDAKQATVEAKIDTKDGVAITCDGEIPLVGALILTRRGEL